MPAGIFKVDLESIADALHSAFPGLRELRPLTVLGRGFRSLALETAGGDVIRVGVSPDAAEDYAKEWRIGDFMTSRLGPLVPKPLMVAQATDSLPYGAIIYKKLPGETPTWGVDPGAKFALDLGTFMARLHGLPVDEARTAGVPEVDAHERLLAARAVVLPVLEARLASQDSLAVQDWWRKFTADPRMRTGRLAVCHHDLWHDNLLRSDSGRLSGVLDIAHVELADPAHDFAAPRYFGERFASHLLSAYRSAGGSFNANDEYRAQRFYEGREFGGLAWAIEHDDQDEVEDSIRKLLTGPIFA